MLPDDFLLFLSGQLSALESHPVKIDKCRPVSGGDINHAYLLMGNSRSWFVKTNNAKRFPGMFEAEARGLQILDAAGSLRVPGVIESGYYQSFSYLILEYLASGTRKKSYWRELGQGLASLHRNTDHSFGLDHDNYIGSLPQSNRRKKSWSEFFIQERLEAQLQRAMDSGMAGQEDSHNFQRLFNKLDSLFPVEPPSLLHGDLWGGNHMAGPHGEPVIIDPAVYYGHREMDLAMSRLFGGFQEEFYLSYNDHYPLVPGWKERTDICNLYPLLVHANLFGQGYMGSVRSIVRRF